MTKRTKPKWKRPTKGGRLVIRLLYEVQGRQWTDINWFSTMRFRSEMSRLIDIINANPVWFERRNLEFRLSESGADFVLAQWLWLGKTPPMTEWLRNLPSEAPFVW